MTQVLFLKLLQFSCSDNCVLVEPLLLILLFC